MARMIPPSLPANMPPGEILFYRALADDSTITKDWTVLCRVELVNTSTTRERELDFIVLVPNMGILVVEIKSHQAIERSAGEWLYGFNRTLGPNPLRDTNDRKHQLKRALKDIDDRIGSNVPVGRLVIFTHAATKGDFTTHVDWHPHEFLDANRYNAIGASQAVINALAPELAKLTAAQGSADLADSIGHAKMNMIAQILCPDYVGLQSAGIRTRYREEELVKLTNNQADALRGLRRSKRVVVTGYAGTGKTTLAVQIAREYASQGLKTALFCYNSNLAAHLESIVSEQNITFIGTAHRFALRTLGLKPGPLDNSAWEKVIRNAIDALRGNPQFDVIIVDEAQDFYQGGFELVDLLDACLRGGLASGSYRMFGDFLHQSLYGQESVLPLIEGKDAEYDLDKNCRNKEDAARFAEAVAGLAPGYSDYLRKGQGGLQVRDYPDGSDARSMIRNVLMDCKARGIKANEIVILSVASDFNDADFSLDQSMPYQIKELFSTQASDRAFVGHTTVRKFKGLEAPYVIIHGVPLKQESMSEASVRDALYVAVTRSLEASIVLVPRSGLGVVRDWLTQA